MVGALLAAGSLGMQAYSAFGSHAGPDYSSVKDQFEARNSQINEFARNLGAARARYLTSLNNMYSSAFSRFSGGEEVKYANRGLPVNGGAFASALAKKSAEYQSQLEPMAFNAEREDLNNIDAARGRNSSGYMSAISGGPEAAYKGGREDMGGFAQTLGRFAQPTINSWATPAPKYNAYSDSNSSVPDYRSSPSGYVPQNNLDLRSTA